GEGQKLERWGDIVLLRPDPQVIWSPAMAMHKSPALHMSYSRSSQGGGQWTTHKKTPEQWSVRCALDTAKGQPVTFDFIVKPMGFKHTGVFPEQIVNWQTAFALIEQRVGQGKSVDVLNLFGYTGAASVVCAKAGATVAHIDAAKNMVEQCRQNAQKNGVDKVRYIVDDCNKFVEREQKRGKLYDCILMDPPSYGRGPGGEMWKLEDNIEPLIRSCVKLLKPDALFFLVNSYTTGLQPTVLQNLLAIHLPSTGRVRAYEVCLPTQDRGIVLPCGCSGLWIGE
ncbi:MAG: class I SAM-dependent methyltransferase, partial [Firmicutes bacterium]|nr:class I SAM-dependent methyltransferase [Bacillota bacterium]